MSLQSRASFGTIALVDGRPIDRSLFYNNGHINQGVQFGKSSNGIPKCICFHVWMIGAIPPKNRLTVPSEIGIFLSRDRVALSRNCLMMHAGRLFPLRWFMLPGALSQAV